MDEPNQESPKPSETGPSPAAQPVNEVRYSLRELMAEVAEERRVSAMGRELVDVHEIEKMFSNARKRRQQ